MANLDRRVQILLSQKHYELLDQLSRQEHCSVAELIRKAIEQRYQPSVSCKALLALEKLSKNSCFSAAEWQKIALAWEKS